MVEILSTSSPRPLAWAYVRMSTKQQEKGDSLRRQTEGISKYAEANCLELAPERMLKDIGVSAFRGKNAVLGELGRLLNLIRVGQIPAGSFLIVESIDRLTRQAGMWALGLVTEIALGGLIIATYCDGNRYSKDSKFEMLMMLVMKIQLAYDESNYKASRSGEGRKVRRKDKHSRACPAWLTVSADGSQHVVIDDRAKIVRRIFEDAAAGLGSYSITKRLEKSAVQPFGKSHGWQTSYISKILVNRAVLGEYQPHLVIENEHFRKTRKPDGAPIAGHYPQIISEKLFFEVQAGRSARRKQDNSPIGGRIGKGFANLFSKKLRCAYCEGPMRYENKGTKPKGGKYLFCDKTKRGGGCGITKGWRYDAFERSVLGRLGELDIASLLKEFSGSRELSNVEGEIRELTGKKTTLESRIKKMVDLHLIEQVPYIQQTLQTLNDSWREADAELRKKIEARHILQQKLVREADSKEKMPGLLAALYSKSEEEQFEIRSQIADRIKSIVSYIYVGNRGTAPITFEAVKFEIDQRPQDTSRILSMKDNLQDPESYLPFFMIRLTNGRGRGAVTDQNHPTHYIREVVDDGEGIFFIDPQGRHQPPPFPGYL